MLFLVNLSCLRVVRAGSRSFTHRLLEAGTWATRGTVGAVLRGRSGGWVQTGGIHFSAQIRVAIWSGWDSLQVIVNPFTVNARSRSLTQVVCLMIIPR